MSELGDEIHYLVDIHFAFSEVQVRLIVQVDCNFVVVRSQQVDCCFSMGILGFRDHVERRDILLNWPACLLTVLGWLAGDDSECGGTCILIFMWHASVASMARFECCLDLLHEAEVTVIIDRPLHCLLHSCPSSERQTGSVVCKQIFV
jgi:hypothetical protein